MQLRRSQNTRGFPRFANLSSRFDFVTEVSQECFASTFLTAPLHTLGRLAINDSHDTAPLVGFSDNDFEWIRRRAIDAANFRARFYRVEHIDGKGFANKSQKHMTSRNFLKHGNRRLSEVIVIALVSNQARARGFRECHTKTNMW